MPGLTHLLRARLSLQVHAALKDWALSEQYYLQAAQSSEVSHAGRPAQPWLRSVLLHVQSTIWCAPTAG